MNTLELENVERIAAKAVAHLQQKDKDQAGLWIILGMHSIVKRPNLKPYTMYLVYFYFRNIPHPFNSLHDSNVCMIIKDNNKAVVKEQIKQFGIKGIKKIVSVSSLKTKYSTFEAKRSLCSEFDIFLVDKSLVTMIPKVLGSAFYKRKKFPIPVDLTELEQDPTATKKHVENAILNTHMFFNNGPCVAILAGNSAQDQECLVKNAVAIVKGLDKIIPNGGHENIKSLHMKSSDSISIPLFSSSLVV